MTTKAKSLSVENIAAHFVGGRLSNQPTSAREKRYYGDPARFVKFGKRGEAEVDRQSDKEKADTLLMEWYRWTKPWRPALGAPRISPSCRDYRQDEKHNDESDEYDALHKKEMKAVEFCVFALEVTLWQAICTEMRNREVSSKVWRSPSNSSYSEALHAVMEGMKKHDDLRQLFN